MKKRVIVTGASSGIGHEVARHLASNGHSLVLVARREAALEKLRDECCENHGVRVEFASLDVSDFGRAGEVCQLLDGLGDGEPVLVNNAGSAIFGDYDAGDFESHWGEVAVNLGGPMAMTHAFLPHALTFGSGQIVNVLSIAAESVFGGAAVYSASKAGARQFFRCISEEYRRRGLRVTNFLPGAVNTPLWDVSEGGPPREQMLSAVGVAELIVGVIESAPDRVVEEVRVTPPFGVL